MKDVAGAIIIKKRAVFLARRKGGEKLSGYWEFPGGKIEEGESPQECLERELFEEFTIRSKAGDIMGESIYHYDHGSFRLLGVLATILDEENLSLTVHDRFEWIDIDKIHDYILAPADIPFVEKIRELL